MDIKEAVIAIRGVNVELRRVTGGLKGELEFNVGNKKRQVYLLDGNEENDFQAARALILSATGKPAGRSHTNSEVADLVDFLRQIVQI